MILSSARSVAALSVPAAGLQSGLPLPADTVRLSAPRLEERWERWEVLSPHRDTDTKPGESRLFPARKHLQKHA